MSNEGVFDLDGTLEQADWSKNTFDFPNVDSAEKLLPYIQINGMTVAHFMTLPVYKLNVKKIAWLKDLEKYA